MSLRTLLSLLFMNIAATSEFSADIDMSREQPWVDASDCEVVASRWLLRCVSPTPKPDEWHHCRNPNPSFQWEFRAPSLGPGFLSLLIPLQPIHKGTLSPFPASNPSPPPPPPSSISNYHHHNNHHGPPPPIRRPPPRLPRPRHHHDPLHPLAHPRALPRLRLPLLRQSVPPFPSHPNPTNPPGTELFQTLHTTVLPTLTTSPLPTPLSIIFRQHIQPWHPASLLTHEAALAVLRLTESSASSFYAFSAALFAAQKEYFDVNVVHESRNATYRRLAKLAAETKGVGVKEDEVYELLVVGDQPGEDGALNVGNGVTGDVKVAVRMGRERGGGVHVSPTVVFDGVVAGEVSSSWDGERWGGWLREKVV